MIKNLNYCPYGQCRAEIYENGGVSLYSYKTLVIYIDPMGWLVCTGTYSATTRRHIGAFLKEYAACLKYYDVKLAYEGAYAININTGEIRPLSCEPWQIRYLV